MLPGTNSRGALICYSIIALLLWSQIVYARETCVVIDTDTAFDDIRAIATLVSTGQVVAIVTTEGIARSAEGALVLSEVLGRGGLSIPIIIGAVPSPIRGYSPPDWLAAARSSAETLNGTFAVDRQQSTPLLGNVVTDLGPLVSNCSHVKLIVIGPWTSFMLYAPQILDKVDAIVVQGRPDPDKIGGAPSTTGFNCLYDKPSCFAAYDMLEGRQQRVHQTLQATWVDIPDSPVTCGPALPGIAGDGAHVCAFRPTEEWAKRLAQARGQAWVVGAILIASQDSWASTLLWDDLTALYFVQPQLFVVRGGHVEPTISADTARDMLLEYMSRSSR
jgi:inosine-uridine nucleoside N-ribohydrolase